MHASVVSPAGSMKRACELLCSVGVTARGRAARRAACASAPRVEPSARTRASTPPPPRLASRRCRIRRPSSARVRKSKRSRVPSGFQAKPQERRTLALATTPRSARRRPREYLASEPVHNCRTSPARNYPPYGAVRLDRAIDDCSLASAGARGRHGGWSSTRTRWCGVRSSTHWASPGEGRAARPAPAFAADPTAVGPPRSTSPRRPEMFHAFCEAGLWEEPTSLGAPDKPRTLRRAALADLPCALPRARLAPPAARPLSPPSQPGTRLELLGQFDEAIAAYRAEDAPAATLTRWPAATAAGPAPRSSLANPLAVRAHAPARRPGEEAEALVSSWCRPTST